MTYYFAWLKEKESFDPLRHCQEETSVLYLKIHQKEGQFPLAEIILPIHPPTLQQTWQEGASHALVSWKKDKEGPPVLLFSGRLLTFPLLLHNTTQKFLLTAEPLHSQSLLQDLHQTFKETPAWDPLFVSDPDHEAQSALYEWSRTTGTVTVSSLFQGSHTLSLKDNFDQESLKMEVSQIPLSSLHVSVKAEWIQQAYGSDDIFPFLASRFPHRKISTLTPEYFQTHWPKSGHRFGQSGYFVLDSSLEKISSLHHDFDSQTPPFWHQENIPHPQQNRLPCLWFKGKLVVGWSYQQKRRETVFFTLSQKIHPLLQGAPPKSLSMTLQDVGVDSPLRTWSPQTHYQTGDRVLYHHLLYTCLSPHGPSSHFLPSFWKKEGWHYGLTHPAQASFFLTDRGKKAVAHAIDRAKAALAASSRALSITLTAPWSVLWTVTTDHTLILEDPRLPGGSIQGKVMSYEMIADGQKGLFFITVTIGCSVGDPNPSFEKKPPPPLPSYGEDLLWEDSYEGTLALLQTPEGIPFYEYHTQPPQEGLLYPSLLRAHDLVESLHIQNSSPSQIKFLEENQYPKYKNIRSLLRHIPTQISLSFKDLQTKPVLNHCIQVTLPDPWVPPAHLRS